MSTEPPTENLGAEGDACATCGAVLATDQRYCLNCGAARAKPRLDFQKHLNPTMGSAGPGDAAAADRPAASMQWNPIAAVGAIALLGVMLMLGVLIGKDDNQATVAAAPATTTTAAPVAAAPTDAAATAATPDKAAKGGGKEGGADKVVQGGTGSTEGISTENPLDGLTGQALADAQKNSPDVIATEGEPPPVDNGAAGGGSDSTCIGC